MYIRIIENKVLEEQMTGYTAVMKKFVDELSATEGCISVDMAIENDTVTTIERWESVEFIEKYATDILNKYKKELKKGFLSNSEKVYLV